MVPAVSYFNEIRKNKQQVILYDHTSKTHGQQCKDVIHFEIEIAQLARKTNP